jgi:predicted enzyme related to lactoylglutathione lyase
MSTHHTIDYIELPATDMQASTAFYTQAFGWAFEDWGPNYQAFKDAGLDGGLRKDDGPVSTGGTLMIIYSDDLAISEAAVTAAGATITARHTFPGGARFHFLDPAGNDVAVWTKTSLE